MIRRSIGTFRGLMVFILLPGVVVAAIISLTGGMAEEPATVLYANSDTGAAGRHLITELEQAGEYKFEPRSDEVALKEATIKQEGTVGVFIPAGYTAALLAGSRHRSVSMSCGQVKAQS